MIVLLKMKNSKVERAKAFIKKDVFFNVDKSNKILNQIPKKEIEGIYSLESGSLSIVTDIDAWIETAQKTNFWGTRN